MGYGQVAKCSPPACCRHQCCCSRAVLTAVCQLVTLLLPLHTALAVTCQPPSMAPVVSPDGQEFSYARVCHKSLLFTGVSQNRSSISPASVNGTPHYCLFLHVLFKAVVKLCNGTLQQPVCMHVCVAAVSARVLTFLAKISCIPCASCICCELAGD